MSIRVVIVEDPLDPRKWEDNEVEDARDFLMERFGTWPVGARIYDMEGFELVDRAAGAMLTNVLASRDVTPRDEAGVERLGQMRGPLLVAVSPADPITAIIAVVAIAVGVAAAVFLMPKIPTGNNTYQSPNNTLSARTNQARPGGRIPDIFGTVRSTPDLLSVPYKMFVNNLEVEMGFMCVGRGAYLIDDVRDGTTPLGAISGAGAAFYGPGTSPNSGDAPQLQIGTPIDEPVYAVAQMNEVNGQVVKPPNNNFLRGDSNVRFVAPDRVEYTGEENLDEYFETDDEVTISNANFGGIGYYDAANATARFYPDYRIEFETLDPRTLFSAGQTLVITNAGFSGLDGTGQVIYVDVSGTYEIDTVSATEIQLVVPA